VASFIEGSNDTVTNGTTAVTAVAAPAANTRRIVKTINVYNADDMTVDVFIQLNNNGTIRIISKTATLAVAGRINLEEVYVLDTTNKSIEVKLGGAVNATELDIVTTYAAASRAVPETVSTLVI